MVVVLLHGVGIILYKRGQSVLYSKKLSTYHQSGQTLASPEGQGRWVVGWEVSEAGPAYHIMVSVHHSPQSRISISNGSHSLRYGEFIIDKIYMGMIRK